MTVAVLCLALNASIAFADDQFEPDGFREQAKPIGVGAPQDRWLEVEDVDWISFETSVGSTYFVRTGPTSSSGGRLDAFVTAFDATGGYLTSTDDCPGYDGVVVAGTGGTVFLSIEGYFGDEIGPYRLSVNLAGGVFGSVLKQADGYPAPAAYVSAHRENEWGGWDWIGDAECTPGGDFELAGLPEGEYLLEFGDYNGAFLVEYWDGALDLQDAQPVTVEPGAAGGPYDVELEPYRPRGTSIIRGQVTASEDGRSLEGIEVSLFYGDYYGASRTLLATMTTDAAGAFSAMHLPQGVYSVRYSDPNGVYATECFDNKFSIDTAMHWLAVGATMTCNASLDRPTTAAVNVVDRDTGLPVVGASVALYPGGADPRYTASLAIGVTNAAGQCEFPGLTQGSYRVHLLPAPGDTHLAEFVDFVASTPGGQSEVTASLVLASSLQGQVTDEVDGAAIPGVHVEVISVNPTKWVGEATTGADGSYSVGSLKPGSFYLRLTPGVNHMRVENTGVVATITAGGSALSGIDISMARPSFIKGRVLDEATGLPVADGLVRAFVRRGSWSLWTSGRTATDGTYQLRVPGGTYRVEFTDSGYVKQFYGGSETVDLATDVVVPSSGTVERIDAGLVLGGLISGTLTYDLPAGYPLSTRVALYRLESDGAWRPYRDTYSWGSFGFVEVAPGQYRVGAGGTNTVRRVFHPDAPLIDEGRTLVVTPGANITGVNMTLRAASSLTGCVTDTSGSPIAGARIDMYLYRPDTDSFVLADATISSGSGTYGIGALCTGTYRIKATAPGRSERWYLDADTEFGATSMVFPEPRSSQSWNPVLLEDASIRATVDVDGAPAGPGIRARLYRYDYPGVWTAGMETSAAADGSFEFAGLSAEASYTIGFTDELSRFEPTFLGLAGHPDDAETFRLDQGEARALSVALGGPDVYAPLTRIFGVPTGWVNRDAIIDVRARDMGGSQVATVWVGVNGAVARSWAGTTTVTAEGLTRFEYWSTDAVGNVEPARLAEVRIDKTPPATVSDARDVYQGQAMVQLTAGDGGSGVAATYFSLDGSAERPYTAPISVTTVGSHNLTFRSVDSVSNTEPAHSVAFTVTANTAIGLTTGPITLAKFGDACTIRGKLELGGSSPSGRRVSLQSGVTPSEFSDTGRAAVTAADGTFAFAVAPQKRTYYRVTFAGDAQGYTGSTSEYLAVTPRAAVGNPRVPKTVSLGQSATVTSLLRPRHASGSYPVRLFIDRYVGGKWKRYGIVKVKVTNYADCSRYTKSLKLPSRGRWRLRAYHPADPGHAASWSSSYGYVTVK